MDGLIETALAKSTEAALEPAKNFLERLLGPMADEVGFLIQDKVRVHRFRNQLRLLAKAQRMLDDAEVKPRRVNMKVLMPLLEGVADEDDELMFIRWSALLANAALPQPKVHPSFSKILSELTPREAIVLEKLYEAYPPPVEPFLSFQDVIKSLAISESEIGIIVDNLIRLGVCEAPSGRFYNSTITVRKHQDILITELGIAFVEACRKPPRKKPMREIRIYDLGGRFDDIDIRTEAYE